MSLGTMEQRTEGMKRQATELIEQAYQRGYAKAEEDYHIQSEKDRDSSYQCGYEYGIEQGRNEAWYAAGKLVSMEYQECNEVLGDHILTIDTVDEIFTRCTASEAIVKIQAYEEKKKQEEDEIHVGDVIRDADVEAVVTWCDGKNWNGFLFKGEEDVGEVGQVYSCMSCDYWKKTGRSFPEIAQVLKKTKEGEGE